MQPTIREVVKRRMRWIFLIAVAGWLIFPLCIFLARKGQSPTPLLTVGFLLFGVAILAFQFAVRCPKCTALLGQFAYTVAFGLWGRRVNFCPYCGVSLDEPVPQKLIS